jgi:hypothetical protein
MNMTNTYNRKTFYVETAPAAWTQLMFDYPGTVLHRLSEKLEINEWLKDVGLGYPCDYKHLGDGSTMYYFRRK